MKDLIISVRMPASLVKELKELSEKNHYMDLSEELRSVLRDKCTEYKQRQSTPDKKVSDSISTQQKTLVEGLQSIIRELQKNEK